MAYSRLARGSAGTAGPPGVSAFRSVLRVTMRHAAVFLLLASLLLAYALGAGVFTPCGTMLQNAIQSDIVAPPFTYTQLAATDHDNDPFTPPRPGVRIDINVTAAVLEMYQFRTVNHTSDLEIGQVHLSFPIAGYVTVPMPYCVAAIETGCISDLYHGIERNIEAGACSLSDRDPGGYSRLSGRLVTRFSWDLDCVDGTDPTYIIFRGVSLTTVSPDIADLYGIFTLPIVNTNISTYSPVYNDALASISLGYPDETCGFSDGHDFPEADQVLCRPDGNELLTCASGGRDPLDATDSSVPLVVEMHCQAREYFYSYIYNGASMPTGANTNAYVYSAAIRGELITSGGATLWSQLDARFRTNATFPVSGAPSAEYARLFVGRTVSYLDSAETEVLHEIFYRPGSEYEFHVFSTDLYPRGLSLGIVPPCICGLNVECGNPTDAGVSDNGILSQGAITAVTPKGYGTIRMEYYDPTPKSTTDATPKGWVDTQTLEVITVYAGTLVKLRIRGSWRDGTAPTRTPAWDILTQPDFEFGNSPVAIFGVDKRNFEVSMPKDIGDYVVGGFFLSGLRRGASSASVILRLRPQIPVVVIETNPPNITAVMQGSGLIVLNASASYDPDNSPSDGDITCLWSQSFGPTLWNATVGSPNPIPVIDTRGCIVAFNATIVDTYKFRVTVFDGPPGHPRTNNGTGSIDFDVFFDRDGNRPPDVPPPPVPGAGDLLCLALPINGTCLFSSSVCRSQNGTVFQPGNVTLCPTGQNCCRFNYTAPPPPPPGPAPTPSPPGSPGAQPSDVPLPPDEPGVGIPSTLPSADEQNLFDLRNNIPGWELITAIVLLAIFILASIVMTVSCLADPRCADDMEFDQRTLKPVPNARLTVADVLLERTST